MKAISELRVVTEVAAVGDNLWIDIDIPICIELNINYQLLEALKECQAGIVTSALTMLASRILHQTLYCECLSEAAKLGFLVPCRGRIKTQQSR